MKRSITSATAAIEHRISGQIGQPASCTILSNSTPSTFDGCAGRHAGPGCGARLGAGARADYGVSNGRFSGQEQAITSRSGDPHDLWKTLWVTRPTGPETR